MFGQTCCKPRSPKEKFNFSDKSQVSQMGTTVDVSAVWQPLNVSQHSAIVLFILWSLNPFRTLRFFKIYIRVNDEAKAILVWPTKHDITAICISACMFIAPKGYYF